MEGDRTEFERLTHSLCKQTTAEQGHPVLNAHCAHAQINTDKRIQKYFLTAAPQYIFYLPCHNIAASTHYI